MSCLLLKKEKNFSMFFLILTLIVIPLFISILAPFWLSPNKKLPPFKDKKNTKQKRDRLLLLKQYLQFEEAYKQNKLSKKEWLLKKETYLKQYKYLLR